ncbi:MAG: hypothetical protein ACT4UP_10100 [Gammaproteobacteria bacterium]
MPEPGRLPQFHIVGFTGHRHIGDAAAVSVRLDAALAELRQLAPGEWIAVSSSASGSDLLFVRAARRCGMAWQALLPLPEAEFREDFADQEWREAQALLAEAESVTVLTGAAARQEAYLDCGIETVNACDVLLALGDGEPARGRGGTAEMVEYARELGKPMLVIDPDTGASRREHFDRFAPVDPDLEFLNGLPDAVGGIGADDDARAIVTRLYRNADAAANKSAPRFRLLTMSTVLLHLTATITATAGLAFAWHAPFLPWAKLLLVLGALGAAVAIRHYRAQRNWVRCRLAAEICRASLATWGMPRRAALFEDLALPGARQLLRSLHLVHRRGAPERRANLDTFRQDYRSHRLLDQLRYYQARVARAAPLLTWLRAGFAASTALAIFCIAAYAVHRALALPPAPRLVEAVAFQFLPIVLPVIAAAFVALVSINDLHRRVARYREMCLLLEATHRQAGVTHSWRSLEQLVRHTERALLHEVLEWHTLMSHLDRH